MVQYVTILMIYYVLSYTVLLVIRTTVTPSKKCLQKLMNTNNFAQAIVTTLWIYLPLLSILVPLETRRIFIRLLSLLALDILLAIWLSQYQKRNKFGCIRNRRTRITSRSA